MPGKDTLENRPHSSPWFWLRIKGELGRKEMLVQRGIWVTGERTQ